MDVVVQVVEAVPVDLRGKLAARAAEAPRLIDHDARTRLADAADHGADIERADRAEVDDLDNYVHRVHTADVPTPYASNLEQEYLPNPRRIVEAVRAATYNL